MPLRVAALAVGHLQRARRFFNTCSLCFKLHGRISKYMIKIIVTKSHYHNS